MQDASQEASPLDCRGRRLWWTAGIVAVYLGAQLAIPALLLAGPRPSRYGWQMYASVPLTTFSVVRRDTSIVAVDLSTVFGNARADLSIDPRVLAPHVCARHSGATALQVKELLTGHTQNYPCAR